METNNSYSSIPSLTFSECEYDIDKKELYEIFHSILKEGNSYIYSMPFNYNDFLNYFFSEQSRVIICKKNGRIVGGYYIKPNFPDRASHISNAGYVVKKEFRGQKFGFYLGQHSIDFAKKLGYRSIMFNLVFEKNTAAINLWLKLGFEIIGNIPNAVQEKNNEFQNAKIMYLEIP